MTREASKKPVSKVPMNRQCCTCLYWLLSGSHNLPTGYNIMHGLCRYRAPVLELLWPCTNENDTCCHHDFGEPDECDGEVEIIDV